MVHGIFNLRKTHWAYFVLLKRCKCLIICETAHYIQRHFGTALLSQLAQHMDQPEMVGWDVRLLRATAGVPAQIDGKSCGVYSCIILESVCKGCRLPTFTHTSLQAWRAHMAHAILSATPSYSSILAAR